VTICRDSSNSGIEGGTMGGCVPMGSFVQSAAP
jgi:hypothetical protein